MSDSPAPSAEPVAAASATLTASNTPSASIVPSVDSDTKSEAPTAVDDERKSPHYLPPPGVGDILTVAPMMVRGVISR